jgi:hypothetical protein
MLSFRGFLKSTLNNLYRFKAMKIKDKSINNLQIVFIKNILLVCLLSIFNAAYASATNGSGSIDKNWNFKVYLDDKEIGFHNFSMVHKDEHHEIYSSARFDVKFLFINAYSYKHDNVERWHGHCLNSINAVTDDNGDLYNVSGEADNEAFIVNAAENNNEKQNKYLPCIKTFAYWDPEFLNEATLLNSQTGEMIEVDSEFVANETLNYKGEEITARHYRLHGKDLRIDLWYSVDDHWLALESLTESGRVIRYAVP